MLNRSKLYAPRIVRSSVRRVFDFFREPELRSVELHLADHCNLNCRGVRPLLSSDAATVC
jgi:hypothetical protein